MAPEVQEERYARFMQRAGAISAARLAAKRRAADARAGGCDRRRAPAIARSEGDAPEIDGVVRIGAAGGLSAGDFADVEIVGADAYDLEAQRIA